MNNLIIFEILTDYEYKIIFLIKHLCLDKDKEFKDRLF
jgi:hypothetical protein